MQPYETWQIGIFVSSVWKPGRFWQIALQLGVSPETITRKLRIELPAEEKEVIFHAIEQIMQGR